MISSLRFWMVALNYNIMYTSSMSIEGKAWTKQKEN